MAKKDLFASAKAALNENTEQVQEQVRPTLKGMGVEIPTKDKMDRTTIMLSADLMKKVKMITVRENLKLREVMIAAIERYVDGYEKVNGNLDL